MAAGAPARQTGRRVETGGGGGTRQMRREAEFGGRRLRLHPLHALAFALLIEELGEVRDDYRNRHPDHCSPRSDAKYGNEKKRNETCGLKQ